MITHARYRGGGRYIRIDTAEWLVGLLLTTLIFSTMFATLAVAAFLALGALLAVSNIELSVRSLVRGWPMLILPAYCLLSTLWSQFPDLTLRYGIQLALSVAIAIVISGRISATRLLPILFVTFGLGTLASVVLGGMPSDRAWQGIFGSKNAFSAHLAVFALISLAMLLDRTVSRWVRVLALIGVLVSGPLLVKAESAGALIVVVPCVGVMLLASASRRFAGQQKLFLVAIAAIAVATVALLITANASSVLSVVLDESGKDPTLTGRTDLWAVGLADIAQHPLLGVGYRAFWVRGYGPAEQLWAMFYEQSGAGFNFHDLYISNAVDLGLIGLGIEVVIIYAGLVMVGILALIRPTATNIFLLGLQLLLVLRSFIEVEVFFEFNIRTVLTICTVIYAVRGLAAERRPRRIPVYDVDFRSPDVGAARLPADRGRAQAGIALHG
jgi:exopolysaccharide production protein ExoQ